MMVHRGIPILLAAVTVAAACSDQMSPRAVDDISLRPDSAHLEPGETSLHQIVVLDEHDREMSAEWLPRIEWTLHDPELADMEVVGDELRVAAKAKGTVDISAELADVKRSFKVFVRPAGLDRVEIDPDPLVVGAGESVWVTTRLYDTEGAEMDPLDFRISFAVVDTTLAYIRFQNRAYEGIVRVSGNAASGDTEPEAGKTQFLARVSGELATFDLRVTLEPTPFYTAPTVEAESSSALKVAWARQFGAREGYQVERAGDVAGPWAEVAHVGSGSLAALDTTYVDTGLTANTTYHYRVRGCNSVGCAIAPSPVGSGTTLAGG